MCSFAGVAPAMVYLNDPQKVLTVDGLGTWPRAATSAYFRGKGHTVIPRGIEQSVVPAAADSWITALRLWGTMSFRDVAAAAIRLARDGFPIHPHMCATLRDKANDFPAGSEAARIYFPNGRAPSTGELLVQTDFGNLLQHLADVERAAGGSREAALDAVRREFYQGDVAARIAAHQHENGGLLTREDLASYRVTIESPQKIDFLGTDVYSCGPWCQGPMLLQTLNILADRDIRALGHNTAEYIHTIVEAIKLSAADREAWYGDPKFVDVPVGQLLSRDYARERSSKIDPHRADPGMPPAGRPGGNSGFDPAGTLIDSAGLIEPRVNDKDTSYVCVVDRHGNAFSATPSDGVMGGAPVIPGLGICISPRGIQSRLNDGHPSSVAAGKRPRLTPNPALLIRPGEYVRPFGSPGGDLQTQAMLQFLLNSLVFEMDLQSAAEAPYAFSYSFPDTFSPHAYFPGKLRIEKPISDQTLVALNALGHKAEWWPSNEWPRAAVCAVQRDIRTGIVLGAADHRRTSYAVCK